MGERVDVERERGVREREREGVREREGKSQRERERDGKKRERDLLIDHVDCDTEGVGHVVECQAAVRLEELGVRQDSHLTHVITVMSGQKAVVL